MADGAVIFPVMRPPGWPRWGRPITLGFAFALSLALLLLGEWVGLGWFVTGLMRSVTGAVLLLSGVALVVYGMAAFWYEMEADYDGSSDPLGEDADEHGR